MKAFSDERPPCILLEWFVKGRNYSSIFFDFLFFFFVFFFCFIRLYGREQNECTCKSNYISCVKKKKNKIKIDILKYNRYIKIYIDCKILVNEVLLSLMNIDENVALF